MSISRHTTRFADLESMSQAAARMIGEQARKSQKARGLFSLVLSGGNTPRRLYEILAATPVAEQIDWQRVFVFWGDERFVPLDNQASNYNLAREHLLARLPAANIFPVPVTAASPAAAAARYEEVIRRFWQEHGVADMVFDCILLGMGADGHCVSLFPGAPLLAAESSLVAAVSAAAGSPPVPRVTLTLPGLAASRRVMFLLGGPGKKKILAEIETGENRYPAALVRSRGDIHWLVSDV